MPLYTFFPMRADGSSLTFAAEFLPSDRAAVRHAGKLRREHTTCLAVEVWEGRRRIELSYPQNPNAAAGLRPLLRAAAG